MSQALIDETLTTVRSSLWLIDRGQASLAALDLARIEKRLKHAAAYGAAFNTGLQETHDENTARWCSPVPPGWDTWVGYLAKHRPEILANMDETPEATQRDGWWLQHRCLERGIIPVKVPAPEVFRSDGIDQLNAYPVELLAERC